PLRRRRRRWVAGEGMGPRGGQDQPKSGPREPVLVQAGHLVRRAPDLLEQRLAPLGLARLPVRVEPRLEQPDELARNYWVRPQYAGDVTGAERGACLLQVLGIRAEHH